MKFFLFKKLSGRKITAALFAAFIAFPSLAGAEVVDKIVAVINESIITQSELNGATAMTLDKMGPADRKDAKKVEEAKKKVLEGLIEQKLVKQASDKAGIDVSEREIDNAVDDIKRQNNNMTQEDLMIALAQSGLTYREYREQLKEQIRQVKFINKEFRSRISVQQEDLMDYYRQRKSEFYGPASYRFNMIFISEGPNLKAKLKAVQEAIARGEDFKAIAREFSDGPDAAEGGDTGLLESGEIDKDIEAAASRLKPGEVSRPITGADGVHIIQLIEYAAPEPRPFESVKGQIHEKLYKKIMDERFSFWLSEVKKYAHIDIRF